MRTCQGGHQLRYIFYFFFCSSSEMTLSFQIFSASGLFEFWICEFCVFSSPQCVYTEISSLPAPHWHLLHLPLPLSRSNTGLLPVPWRITFFCLFWSWFLWCSFNRFLKLWIGRGIEQWIAIHPCHVSCDFVDPCCIPRVVPCFVVPY